MVAVTPLPQPASIDETLASFDSVPLFMKSLPQGDTDNDILGALQSLAFDGTPDEIAQNFKDQGNDYFKGRRYREALSFYTQGVDTKPTDTLIHEALLCNRAACNLELKNYGSVLKDCSTALTLNPKSSKAYYRSSLALIALGRLEEALDCCDRCIEFDKDNKSILSVRERTTRVKTEKERKEQERWRRTQEENELKQRLSAAFQERNLIPITNPHDSADNPYSPHFDPEDSTLQTLIIPVFFLYPEHATSDIVSHFVEDTTFAAHLTAMFPPHAPAPEWDRHAKYVNGQLVVYAITLRKRLLKVGEKMTLIDVCKAARGKEGEPRDGLEVKDGYLTFVVLPRGEVETRWIEEFKKARDS